MNRGESKAFEFTHQTRVVLGAGVWLRAGAEARSYGERVLLVTGASSLARLELAGALEVEAARLGLVLNRFSVPREPDTELADRAAALARETGAQAVLAIGGGSALDVGKAAAALATNPGSARDYLEGLPAAPRPIESPPLPVVCVPTTAGTGSEVTRNSVLQVPDLQVKRSMRSDLLYPRAAFVDPTLSGRAPRAVRAGSGFDALTHLAEAFCSTNASPFTDALARDGVPRAVRGLRALRAGHADAAAASASEGSEAAAYDLAVAATLGGMCLANAGLGAAHGLVAPLGGLYPNIPHGAALACLLPATLAVNQAAAGANAGVSARLLELARLISGPYATVLNTASELVELRVAIGLPALSSYGDIDVARVIASPSGSIKTNPVALGAGELRDLLELALRA